MHREPIAIIGIGCRFPGAKNPEAFWQLLHAGVDAITEVPRSRWDVNSFYDSNLATPGKMNTRWGGFLEQVDQFDPQFFSIAPEEAALMDPQQRLLLEVTWEALEDAGQIPQHLAGTRTGVFVGISSHDYSQAIWGTDNPYATTGTSNCIAANRISYTFNFQGPSLAVDTACSSSLVAIHLACQSLWTGESTLGLVGGVHVILSPWVTASFAKAGAMAPDGRCKTFDARADGYVRSEGVGVVVLKPLSLALASGDPIYAVIRGSAVNQDGRSNGLTAPNPSAQQALLREAYRQAAVSPGQVQYVEAHGTGTKLGDSMEMKVLGALLAEDRRPGNYCAVGSVKTNIGHLEAASGIAALIKVALSLKHRQIPPSLHFQEPNPLIHFEKLPLRVQQTLVPWPEMDSPALAGVSSFGFGGTNAHVVLEEAPDAVKSQKQELVERPVHLLTLRAKSEQALRELARCYEEFLAHSTAAIADICFSANTGRSHFNHRLAVVAESTVQLQAALGAFSIGRETAGLVSGQVRGWKPPKIAFLFAEGSQYVGMGRRLYESQPIFRDSLDLCDQILRSYLKKPLLEVLYPAAEEERREDEANSPHHLLEQTLYAQPALFALEYALFELWKSWGIEPTVVMGYGVGEYVAACVAGVFSLEDGLKLIMEPTLADFERVASGVTYSLPRLSLVSNVTGELVTESIATSEYWCDRVHQPVKFAASINTLHQQGYEVFVEIGAKPTLLEIGQYCLPEGVGVLLPSLCQGMDDWRQLLQSLGELYVCGVKVNWSGLDRDYPRRRVALPTYPWQRTRYWYEKADLKNFDTLYQTEVTDNSALQDNLSKSFAEDPILQQGQASIDSNLNSKINSEILRENGTQEFLKNQLSELIGSSYNQTSESIQNWIEDWLTKKLKIDPKLLNRGESFATFGVDSFTAVQLANDLTDWLKYPLEATLLWNFSSIESLGGYLGNVIGLTTSSSPTFVQPLKVKQPKSGSQQSSSGSDRAKIPTAKKGIEFSLFYFSSNEAEFTDNKYELLKAGAKFADKHGFTAVWIPERHFHPFGGIYPNPSVLGAALTMVTERVRIRAGSVVLPLQNPIRIAEEWSVVDNLSGGRVDIAFARGWNPDDFVLSPQSYANRTEAMFSGIQTVRKLWRGESILLPNGVGEETEIKIYPLPKQSELPIWITCSGGNERFIEAGVFGANILTALLFQPIEELAEKIALYRDSLAKNGYDPEAGHVTLMLHTFVGEDMAVVRNKVRGPFTEYLKTSVDLWRRSSKSLDDLTEKEREDLLAYAFERYFQTSALFGTPDTCLEMVTRLKEIGVNEIACLIDFGVDVDSVMSALHVLKRLKDDGNLGINSDTRQQEKHQYSQVIISDTIDPEKAEQLLTKIDQLSEQEVNSLLSELLATEEAGK